MGAKVRAIREFFQSCVVVEAEGVMGRMGGVGGMLCEVFCCSLGEEGV